jgi:hypothetical protein
MGQDSLIEHISGLEDNRLEVPPERLSVYRHMTN